MIQLETHRGGVVLWVRAQPGARANALRGTHEGALKVAVTQAPEKGKANRAITQLLSQLFELKRSQIELLTGHTGSAKKFLIRDITLTELRQRIEARLA